MSFQRALGPFDATMVVIGGIIGAGIFINPYIVAQRLDSPVLVLGAWVAGGLIALAGAFAYAELGALFPRAGGQYVYLRDGVHPLAGFLYGWALLLLIESGAIAAVAITFATVAEEIQNARRNLPLSLLAGTTSVVIIYVLINTVYLRALGLDGLANTMTPASDAAGVMFGAVGDRFVTATIAISTFGFLHLAILVPTRVYYAMAVDRTFVPALATLHPRFLAILMQSTWSCVLALTGHYAQLLNYVVFADWIFFGLTVATVLVFRRRLPLAGRTADTFRAPGYPIVQMAFVLVAAAVVVLSVVWAIRPALFAERYCWPRGFRCSTCFEPGSASPAKECRPGPCGLKTIIAGAERRFGAVTRATGPTRNGTKRTKDRWALLFVSFVGFVIFVSIRPRPFSDSRGEKPGWPVRTPSPNS